MTETKNLLNEYFTITRESWPEGLGELYTDLMDRQDDTGFISLGLAIRYLESLMLAQQTLPFGTFYPFKGTV